MKPIALMLIQENPRANYMVQYAVKLEARARAAEGGSRECGGRASAGGSVPLLGMKPGELALAFGDILGTGDQSKYVDSSTWRTTRC